MRPVEGFYVEDADGAIFAVKGILHPRGRLVVVPRYVPSKRGERGGGARRYHKMPSSSYKLTMDSWPRLRYVDPYLGVELLAMRVGEITKTYDPVLGLAELRRRASTPLHRACVSLADALESGGVEAGRLGVSGSMLLGLERGISDIDLVVYGYADGRRGVEVLRGLRAQGQTSPRGGHLPNPMHIPAKANLVHEGRKALKGMLNFKGRSIDFLVRCIPLEDECRERYGGAKHTDLGPMKAEAIVVDDGLGTFLPTRYGARGTCPEGLRFDIVSYGGIICEQARRGERVLVSGKKEIVDEMGGAHIEIVVDMRGHYLYCPELVGRKPRYCMRRV